MLVNLCQCIEQRKNSDQSARSFRGLICLPTYREEWMSIATYRECVTQDVAKANWQLWIPHPHQTIVPWRGCCVSIVQTPHVLCRKACRECAIHVVVTAADSCEYRIINTFYPFHWVIRAGGKNVGNLWESAGRERANRPPPQQHSSQ